MNALLIKNGRIIDPSQKIDEKSDILIKEKHIVQIGHNLSSPVDGRVVDAEGKWVIPGLIDMHVHLREPGREDKETIESGTAAAASGGFTAVACMPNTQPVNDSETITRYILEKASDSSARVYPIAAITVGLKGQELVEMSQLSEAGAVAFSDDGKSVDNTDLLRRALEYVRMFDKPIIQHCEDMQLSAGGQMHEGVFSTRLGLLGIPELAEDLIVARDIRLAEYTESRIHIAHISTKRSVELVRYAKSKGVKVTAEVTPHHLFLTDEDLLTFDTNFKMNPPLRTENDRLALLEALLDGTLDCIASDHAPHTEQEKKVEFNLSPFGIIGLETALPLILTKLIHSKKITPSRMVELMSLNPSKILGIPGGTLSEGSPADITVIDPERFFIVDPQSFKSKSRNTPFSGMSLRGMCAMTVMDGQIRHEIAGF